MSKDLDTVILLNAHNIHILKQQTVLINHISMHLEKGELLALVGPNGAGKSTLLKALAQLCHYEGSVCYQGQDLRRLSLQDRAQTIAYLQQTAATSWPITVRDYIALGRTPHQRPWMCEQEKQRNQCMIDTVIQQTALTQLASRRIHQLSGGEFARVRLARAFVVEAPLLLADEPVASLDPFHQLQVMELLKRQCKAGKSVIVVLHDLTLASRFCDRLILLSEGRLIDSGEPRKILSPDNLQKVYKVKAMVGEYGQQAFVVPWTCYVEHDLKTKELQL